ncbi:flagellar hook protein FlgE [Campylobacter concisus]|uniref:flagellar hook protein FlgE n=1 Tax=Campylobacter concisus TaxID=199 RepID=UPI000D305382|nr:flagellar hook protein FlgE [Campylobacter concisus]
MMRSLWSGVSGLQAHQIAMDVEGNNIANVNTYGFKYNRANFADILSQTPRVATAPQGQLGGQNAMQIGLGTTINSTTRIFSQGTLTATDKQTDLALQGNGFFVVSPDGGTTRYYTRNGDFVRDKAGNFVNNSGYIVQGWTRDDETGTIDSTGPISNIVIKEGLTTPARATTEVKIKGNLDSGNSIGQRSTPIYALDSVAGGIDYDNDGKVGPNEAHNENDVNNDKFYTNSRNEQILTERGVDLGVTFDELGNGLALRDKQGIWVSYANAKTHKFIIGSGDPHDVGSLRGDQTLNITLNGEKIGPKTVNSISDIAAAINAQYNKTGVSAEISEGNKLTLINRNNSGTTKETKNIHLTVNGGDTLVAAMTALGEPNGGLRNQEIITAYQYVYTSSQTTAIHQNTDAMPRQVTTTEDLRAAMQKDAREYVDYNGDGNGTIPADTGAVAEIKRVKALGLTTSAAVSGVINPPYKAKYDAAVAALPTTTSEDDKIKAGLKAAAGNLNDGVKITVNKSGQFQLENPADDVADQALYMTVTGLTEPAKDASTAAVNENVRLTTMMKALDGALSPGQAQRASGKMMMSSHGSTAEIFDSLGSKHTVSIKWAKTGTTKDGGTEWNMIIQVPEPAKINYSGEGPDNVVTGSVRFNSNGSLASFHPSTITFSANNGSQGGQSVNLNFGLGTDFNGLTSFDKDSSTDSISQDGYTGGTLNDLKIDETGTIIGAFTNGQSFGLAQVALASFTNNEGLQSEGGNVFSQTANSGEAVIGAAGTGDKGTIAASKLEASNVDLSRALTDLIVIQRGFQANSKTITTSDEMLNTLLQLKQ